MKILEREISPLFITGPFIELRSDRKTFVYKISNQFKARQRDGTVRPHFKYFLPDWIIKKDGDDFLVKINNFCLRNTFGFESALNEISLEKIMFPHTGSSIYEMAQFNNMYSSNNVQLIPKKHYTNFSDNEKYVSKVVELGKYIKLNHNKTLVKYPNVSNEESGYFPIMNYQWMDNFIAKLVKKYSKKSFNFHLRVFNKKSYKNRMNFIHIIENDSKNIFVPPKIIYAFLYEATTNISYSNDEWKDLTKFSQKLKRNVLNLIREKYSKCEYYHENYFKNRDIKIYCKNLGVHFNEKMLFLTLFLVMKITNLKKIITIIEPKNVYSTFVINNRSITAYSRNILGDKKKNIDKEVSKSMIPLLKKIHDESSMAYMPKEVAPGGWLLNVKPHIDNVYGVDRKKNRLILKMDISSFFNSMNHELINEELKKNNFNKIVFDEECIKQGLKLSAYASEVLMSSFDKEVKELLPSPYVYTRYSDDITISISTDSEIIEIEKKILNAIGSSLKKRKLNLNSKKLTIFNFNALKPNECIKITGIIFKKDAAYIPTRLANRLITWSKEPVKYGLSEKYVKNLLNDIYSANVKIKESAKRHIKL